MLQSCLTAFPHLCSIDLLSVPFDDNKDAKVWKELIGSVEAQGVESMMIAWKGWPSDDVARKALKGDLIRSFPWLCLSFNTGRIDD